jgi:Tfp pilus assembly PilM family ATPase
MAHYLAVDWDATELRLVLAASQRGLIRILKAESAPLEFAEGPDETQNVDFGMTLKHLVKRCKVPYASLLLGLNRSSVDMMTFRLPKSKPEELPDLVKNQALRDSPGFTETSPLDFIFSPAPEGDQLRTIATTVSKAQLKQYRGICQAAGLRAKRIEFRPLALAELYWNSTPAADQPMLLVQCTASEIDMVVVEATHVVFVRSIKLPESLSDRERTDRIASEIGRTIAVSRQEIEGATLEKVIIYGNADEFTSLQERLTDQEIETVIQNPFQLPCIWAPARANITGVSVNPGHYAALFGMILSEQSKSPARIDFLHPREKPQPLNIARFVVLFLLLAGIVGFAAYYWNKQQLAQLTQRLADLDEEVKELQMESEQLAPKFYQWWYASSWENQPLIWLDELRDISVRLPAEQDLVIDQMRFTIAQPYCIIDLRARVRDVGVLQDVTRRFADNFHRVTIVNQQRNQYGGGYPISCSIRIQVGKRDNANYYLYYLTPELRQLSQIPPDFPTTETPENTARNTTQEQPSTVPPVVQNTSQPPAKPIARHILPVGYVPLEHEADDRQQPLLRHVIPGGYLPNDALEETVSDSEPGVVKGGDA